MKQVQRKWTKKEVDFLTLNYGKLKYREIAVVLTGRTIYQIRNKANYEKLTNKNNLRKYSINKNYFRKPTIENCYWAGFIGADGNIGRKNTVLSIGLASKDVGLLEQFVRDMDYTNTVKIYSDRAYVSVNCKEIVRDLLKNFNITERKSRTLQPPNITGGKLVGAYIKGIIDGDGSIERDRITIYGTKPLLEWIKEYFDKLIPKGNYKIARVRKIQSHLYAYRVACKRMRFIYRHLRGIKTHELKRKWRF